MRYFFFLLIGSFLKLREVPEYATEKVTELALRIHSIID